MTSTSQPPSGRIGQYVIERPLGQGATSLVFEALDEKFGRMVALKVLDEDLAHDPDAVKRIEREVAILEKIRHPNVARLYDFGRLPDGRPYLVFELIHGITLASVIESGARVDPEIGLTWMREAAEALEEAWKHHVIHRDIKPGNMMIDHDGRLKLLDFGLAKAVHEPRDAEKTNPKALLGTPRYMSPEMAQGRSLDYRADMYSLGATFYHLFLRQSPFDAESLMGIVMKHVQAPLPVPHNVDPNLPHDISDILVRLLAKDPAQRYHDYHDLISDLREAKLALKSHGSRVLAEDPGFDPMTEGDPSLADPRLGGSDPAWGASSAPAQSSAPPPIELGPMQARLSVMDIKIKEPEASATARVLLISAALFLVLGVGIFVYVNFIAPPPSEEAELGWLSRTLGSLKIFGGTNVPRAEADRLDDETRERMQTVMSVLNVYEHQHGEWPTTLGQLVEEGLVEEDVLLDAWDNRFIFNRTAKTLRSSGANGVEGDEDDFLMNASGKFISEPESVTVITPKD